MANLVRPPTPPHPTPALRLMLHPLCGESMAHVRGLRVSSMTIDPCRKFLPLREVHHENVSQRLSAAFCWLLCVSAEAADVRIVPEGQTPATGGLSHSRISTGTSDGSAQVEGSLGGPGREAAAALCWWPMACGRCPRRRPAKAVLHSKIDRGDYTVEKVYFESFPGHYVTGLSLPTERQTGKATRPSLSPHGHGGRLQDHGPTKIKQLITEGREQFESGRSTPKRARCVGLARMGCVVFIWDMLGYADSQQISRQLAHGFAKQRPEFEITRKLGFLQHAGGIADAEHYGRADVQRGPCARLDQLAARRGPQPHRRDRRQRRRHADDSVGGRSTLVRSSPSPTAWFSTAMQGGCTCENTSCLRIGTGNIELTAPVRSATRRHDRGERLDQGHHDQGLSRIATIVRDAGRQGKRAPPNRCCISPQLQLRQSGDYVRLDPQICVLCPNTVTIIMSP